MTSRKRLKRLVRSRAQRTGESYVTALRHLRSRVREETAVCVETRRVTKSAYGFAMDIPSEWRELGPDRLNSDVEVAHFAYPGEDERRGCRVFRAPVMGILGERVHLLPDVLSAGFEHFEITEITVAERQEYLMTAESKQPERRWALRYYIFDEDSWNWCLAFASSTPEADADTFDHLAATFESVPLDADAQVQEAERLAPRVTAALPVARFLARELGHPEVNPAHLVLAFLADGEGIAAVALGQVGVSYQSFRAQVVDLVTPPQQHNPRPILSAETNDLLYQAAAVVAAENGHNRVGTEHILVAALDNQEGIVSLALAALRVNPTAVRNQVTEAWRSFAMG